MRSFRPRYRCFIGGSVAPSHISIFPSRQLRHFVSVVGEVLRTVRELVNDFEGFHSAFADTPLNTVGFFAIMQRFGLSRWCPLFLQSFATG